MNKLHSLKLFKDIQSVSTNYNHYQLNDNDIDDNKKLNYLLQFYKSKIDEIKKRSNLISKQARDEIKNSSPSCIYNTLIDLNNFSLRKYNNLKLNGIESTPFKAILFATIDELILVNKSIQNKEYLEDKNTYFYIYEKVIINAFMTFLALNDMNIEKESIKNLSQAIFTQIKVLSIISI